MGTAGQAGLGCMTVEPQGHHGCGHDGFLHTGQSPKLSPVHYLHSNPESRGQLWEGWDSEGKGMGWGDGLVSRSVFQADTKNQEPEI